MNDLSTTSQVVRRSQAIGSTSGLSESSGLLANFRAGIFNCSPDETMITNNYINFPVLSASSWNNVECGDMTPDPSSTDPQEFLS